MALIAAAPTNCTVEGKSASRAAQISAGLGIVAGEALLAAAPCYIRASDGKAYMSNGTAANEAAKIDGFTPKAYAAGEPVTLCGRGVIFEYSAGLLTIGATYYIGTTAGRLDTAATTGDAVGVARAFTTSHIRITRDS